MPKRAGRKSKAQTPAPPSERIVGSKKNPKGSAASEKSASKIKLNEKTLTALKNKLSEFKKEHPNKKNITLNDLKAVYRRGAGAYSKSHRPTITGGAPNTRNAWSMARVNKFLKKAGGQKVKAAYVQDDDLLKMEDGGNTLLAPNGKPSNLTPEQYKLVRTPQFKAWFGDWENDPNNASKVVDENGEPLVVYRGVKGLYDYKKSGNQFFTPDLSYAKAFGYNIVSCFLNIRDLLDLEYYNKIIKEKKYETPFGDRLFQMGDAFLNENKNFWYENQIILLDWDDTKLADEILDRLKEVDGIVGFEAGFREIKSYLVWKPNQIKLADGSNTTFDGSNPDIRFENGGKVQELIRDGIVEIKMFDTTNEHSKEYGFDAKNPLYIQSIFVSKEHRGKGIGSKVFEYIVDYAKENNHDLIFGHITQQAEPSIDIIKSILNKSGFNTIEGNNDFYKIIDIRYAKGGEVGGIKYTISKGKYEDERIVHFEKGVYRGKQIEEHKETFQKSWGGMGGQGWSDPNSRGFTYPTLKEAIKRYLSRKINQLAKGGLLAPNGKPSNLTPEQYKLVRTPQFKAWFGDWEKDPNNASKVLDKNGEPKVMWHGSNMMDEISVFKSSKGFDYSFFSEDRGESSRYVLDYERAFPNDRPNQEKRNDYYNKKIKPFFINARNVFDYSKLTIDEIQLTNKFLQENKDELYEAILKSIKDMGTNLKDYLKELDIEENISKIGLIKYFISKSSDDWWVLETKPFQKFIKENNYDSFVTHESGVWNIAVYKPNQIKLADGSNTTFDGSNLDIRYEKGGLLAPNGKPSNLTPELYKLVRTPQFKAWFGDWENDPKNASKVVDENGEPLVVYRGVNPWPLAEGFNPPPGSWDYSRQGYQYFARNRDYSRGFGSTKPFFLNIRDLLDFNYYNDILIKNGIYREYTANIEGIFQISDYIEEEKPYLAQIGRVANKMPGLAKEIKNKLKTADGFHGYEEGYYGEEESYVVKNANQIKLADGSNTTFDVDNDDARYEKGGLLAPNGKKSLLTEEQYKLVRTLAFKKWFGDWENDPANASKVVDENGEPKVVYHGSDNNFSVFDFKTNKGVYSSYSSFTNNKKLAESYGSNIYNVFLKIHNPYIIDGKGDYIWNVVKGKNSPDLFFDELPLNYDGIIFKSVIDFNGKLGTKFVLDISDIYMVRKPSQIKLADGSNTTFDVDSDDIRYVEGGRVGGFEDLENEWLSKKIEIFLDKAKPFKFYFVDPKTNSLIVGFDDYVTQEHLEKVYSEATSSKEFFYGNTVEATYNKETGDTIFRIKLRKKVEYYHGGDIYDDRYIDLAPSSLVHKILWDEGYSINVKDRYILSHEKEISFRDKDQEQDTNASKPKGLWYSFGYEWANWVSREMPERANSYDYIHKINVTNKVLRLETIEQCLEFTDKFGSDASWHRHYLINWDKVAKVYSGIEVTNPRDFHLDEERMGGAKLWWLYAWDVGSGCIWREDGIESIELVYGNEYAKGGQVSIKPKKDSVDFEIKNKNEIVGKARLVKHDNIQEAIELYPKLDDFMKKAKYLKLHEFRPCEEGWELEYIEIQPKYQGQGYAKKIMNEVKKWAKKNSVNVIFLYAQPYDIELDDKSYEGLGFKSLINFYENSGFERISENSLALDLQNRQNRFAKGGEVDFDCYEIDVDENIEYAKGGNIEDVEVEKINKKIYLLSYGNKGYLRLVNEPYSIFSLDDYTDKEAAVKELEKYGIDKGERTWHISLIHVEPKYRGQGVASILLNACIQWAKKNNYKKLVLFVQPQGRGGLNYRELLEFYTKYKFKKLKKHYGREWMIRKLAKGGEVQIPQSDYLRNITYKVLSIYSKDDAIEFHANFGDDGGLTWEIPAHVVEQGLANEPDYIIVQSIDRSSSKVVTKEESKGEGTKAIASLFNMYPSLKEIGYDDYSQFDSGGSFWQKIGGSGDILTREKFFQYYDSKNYAKGGEVDEKVIKERWAKKKDSLMNMADNIRSLRTNLRKDLKSDDEKDRLTALAISLMDKTAERVGNDESEANGHLGITGLSKRNVKVEGNTITLKYVGKSGVKHEKQFSDEGIANALKDAIANSQSKYVFETSDGFRIKNDRVNRYLSEYYITAKDLRGYSANQWIVSKLREVKDKEILGDEAKRKKKFNEIVKSVAEKVGHGAPTLKKHYMLPSLEREWINHGRIVDLSNIKRAFKRGGDVGLGNINQGGSVINNIDYDHLDESQDLPNDGEGVFAKGGNIENRVKGEITIYPSGSSFVTLKSNYGYKNEIGNAEISYLPIKKYFDKPKQKKLIDALSKKGLNPTSKIRIIEMLRIWENYRGKGYASYLLQAIIEYYKETGDKYIVLGVGYGSDAPDEGWGKKALSHKALIDFYSRYGFEMITDDDDYMIIDLQKGKFDKGGDIKLNEVQIYHEENGNWFVPKNTIYAWLYDDPKANEKLNSGEYDFVLFPPTPPIFAGFQRGFVPPLLKIWKKSYQKEFKGSDKLIGIVKAWYDENDKKLYIIMMTTKEEWRRKGVNSHIIKALREKFELEKEQVVFDKPTKEGERFMASDKYAQGGEVFIFPKVLEEKRDGNKWIQTPVQYKKGELVMYSHSDGGYAEARVIAKAGDKIKIEILNPYYPWTRRVEARGYVNPAGRTEPDYYLNEVPRGAIKTVNVRNIENAEKYFKYVQKPISKWLKSPEFKEQLSYLDNSSMAKGGVVDKGQANYGEPNVTIDKIPLIHETINEYANSILKEGFKKSSNKNITLGVYTIPLVWKESPFDNSSRSGIELKVKLKKGSKIFWTNTNRPMDFYYGVGNKYFNSLFKKLGGKHDDSTRLKFLRNFEKWLDDNGYCGVQQGGEIVITNLSCIDIVEKYTRDKFSKGGDLEKEKYINDYLENLGLNKPNISPKFRRYHKKLASREYEKERIKELPYREYKIWYQIPAGASYTTKISARTPNEARVEFRKRNGRDIQGNTTKILSVTLVKEKKLAKGGELSDENKKEIYKKWKSLINMSKSELEKFYNSEEGKVAGLTPQQAKSQGIDSGRESARWIMKMKSTSVKDWTPTMWKWAKKQISFVSRMSGNKGPLYDEKGNKTRKHTSLLIWGHNPKKKAGGGEIDIPIKENNMNEVTYNQLPAINDLGVGKKFVLKEHFYDNEGGKPTHRGCRYLIVENMGDAQMADCLKLKVHHAFGGGGVTTRGIITRPIKNIMNKGREMGESLTSGLEKAYKKGGELDPDKKEVKEYFEHKSGAAGGLLVGKRHSEGGIQAINKSTGQPLEMEGGEVVITRDAVSDSTLHDFNGKQMTNREILSAINESGGGVSFADGGDVSCKCSGKEYKFGGKTYKDYELFKKINNSYGSKEAIKKGMEVEDKEHGETFKMLKNGEITYEQFLKKLVVDHLSENPKYYDK